MKGSILTTKTWFLLIGAALLISAGPAQRPPARAPRDTTVGRRGVGRHQRRCHCEEHRERVCRGPRVVGAGRPTDWHQLRWQGRAEPITSARDVQIYLEQARVGGQLHYLMQRPSYSTEADAYWADLDNLGAIHKWTPRELYINLIGLVYLFVGFFVLFKQGGRAPYALHFATFCLAAFVFLFYTPVGSYRDLDLAIAFLDNAALILFAPLFLHFCALYPSRQQLFTTRRWRAVLLYVPALLLLVFSVIVFLRDELAKAIPPFTISPSRNNLFGLFYWLEHSRILSRR